MSVITAASRLGNRVFDEHGYAHSAALANDEGKRCCPNQSIRSHSGARPLSNCRLGGLGNHHPKRIDLEAQPDRLRDVMGWNRNRLP